MSPVAWRCPERARAAGSPGTTGQVALHGWQTHVDRRRRPSDEDLVHLKSLTVKGFKSFASATTLRLEPGITCVVGPNGSGKSNVVDAIAWVLGEQGAKALRGGKMEDVIFAGTAGRAPLGRAEVTLTIDNADGALPIDYTEVSITRRMFRSGESEYEINGNSCRLLDIQELLSDSGIGREMHVIVGQGQLDAVLHAKPEDRRAFIEEAAGVLKHRKRKEKALRKLDAMQTNLNRLTDLTAELRRQLKPLGRQAEVARRAAGIQADLRDARLRLLADDLHTLRTTLDKEIADEAALRERREQVEDEHRRGAAPAGRAGGRARRGRAAAGRRPGHLVQAVRAAGALPLHRAAGRRAAAAPAPPRRTTSGPAATRTQLDAEAERVREQEDELREALDRGPDAAGRGGRAPPGAGAPAGRGRAGAGRRRQGDRRPAGRAGQAHRPGERGPGPHRQRAPRRSSGWPPRTPTRRPRAEAAQAEVDAVAAESTEADRDNADLDARHAEAVAAHDRAAARGQGAVRRRARRREGRGELEGPRGGARARPAPQGRRRRAARPGRPGARPARQPGRRCSPSEPGHEAALAAALGALADAVAVTGVDEAVEAMRYLKIEDAGRAALLVGSPAAPGMRGSLGRAAAGAAGRRPLGAGRGATARTPSGRRCTGRCATWSLVDDLAAADRLVAQQPRAARGHAGRRRARRVRGGRRLGQGAPATSRCRPRSTRRAPSGTTAEQSIGELQRAARRGPRRGGRAARRPCNVAAAAEAGRRGRAQRRRPPARRAGRRRPVGQGRDRAARRVPARRPRRPATGTWPGSPSWRSGCGWPRPPRSTRNRPPRSGTSSPRWCRRPGRTRWRCGSPSVPPRSGSRRSPAGPTR